MLEGARRAGGGMGEAVGEAVGEAMVRDTGREAVVGVAGESDESGEAHRGRLLEFDLDSAAGGVFDGLFGLFVEVVAL